MLRQAPGRGEAGLRLAALRRFSRLRFKSTLELGKKGHSPVTHGKLQVCG